jgi:hypothetical protein
VFHPRIEAIHETIVLVAVNRGDGKTITIQTGIDITPGYYTGLLTPTSEANQGNSLTVTQEGQATIVWKAGITAMYTMHSAFIRDLWVSGASPGWMS